MKRVGLQPESMSRKEFMEFYVKSQAYLWLWYLSGISLWFARDPEGTAGTRVWHTRTRACVVVWLWSCPCVCGVCVWRRFSKTAVVVELEPAAEVALRDAR